MRSFLQTLFAGWIGITIGQIVWIEYFQQPFNLQLFNVLMVCSVVDSLLITMAVEECRPRRMRASLESRDFHGFSKLMES